MDITNAFEKLQLTSSSVVGKGDDDDDDDDADLSFVNFFFKKGSVGRLLFEQHVVPYLSLDDLLACAKTCRPMNTMCRAYMVGEVLSKYSVQTSRFHKMELGKFVLGTVSTRYNTTNTLRRRRIRTRTESFWARLYHPSLLPELEMAMYVYLNRNGIPFNWKKLDDDFDWDANTDETSPVLVSASFGHPLYGSVDVTVILRYLLLKQGNTALILKRPFHGPGYWYIGLFGDPCERVTKKLVIQTRNATGLLERHVFIEDTPLKMKLHAKRLDD